jgi:thiamine-monophosphate kinase
MNEFDFIDTLLRPLAHADFSDLFRNDAARLPGDLVITTDTLNEGVHFLPQTDAALLAKKALRVNLSDLAAMGAAPEGYLLNLSLPEGTDERWLKAFTQGLAEDQKRYGIALLGGDTTCGPLSITVTALGQSATPLLRSTAQAGDDVWVTGTIGDAALGLHSLQQRWGYAAAEEAYHLPDPPLAFAAQAAPHLRAALDVSDGLMQDAGHIARQSAVALLLRAEDIPFSHVAQQALNDGRISREQLLSGGDDYQLCFTAAPDKAEPLLQLAAQHGIRLSRIGSVCQGEGVRCVDASGESLSFAQHGWQHF